MVQRGLNVHRNKVLGLISNADLILLEPHLERVSLRSRQRLQSANRAINCVYFPESGIASVVALSNRDRKQAEVALVGRDGMTGISVLLGIHRSPWDVFMQVEGEGLCISSENLRKAADESQTLLKSLLLYAHVFMVQSTHTALANARGKIEDRLARWLLMTRDRLDGDEMVLTHEFMALMLGVRRAGVSTALQAFESQGLITAARGRVTICDRDGLEVLANGLYGSPEAEFVRLLS